MQQTESIRNRRALIFLGGAAVVVMLALTIWRLWPAPPPADFSGELAWEHVRAQVAFGPRVSGTPANIQAGDYIAAQLKEAGWAVAFQPFSYMATDCRNIIARANVGRGPVIILGAHYDSRKRADQDPNRPDQPVPGANDGASGVAVLLEVARTLQLAQVPNEIWLAFFDAEDNGDLEHWDWIQGSTYMAMQLSEADLANTQAMILLDMVGDANQQFYFDTNSNPELNARVWATAARLGYADHFLPLPKWAMLDDHIPFVQRGIPSIDIIDFDYPQWHTTADTPDQVKAESLARVGRTMIAFLETEAP